MLADILFPLQYRRRLLAVLCMRAGQWFHLRELERLTSVASVGSLKKELDLQVAIVHEVAAKVITKVDEAKAEAKADQEELAGDAEGACELACDE